MARILCLAVLAAAQSQQELQSYQLLKDLRARGFTCPGGRVFAPNPGEFLFDCRAWKAARGHAQDMANRGYFSHVNPEGKNPCDRSAIFCSENIAAGQATPQAALDAWKASEHHCPNMMDPSLNRMGAGYGKGGPYVHYWVQDMGKTTSLDQSCQGGPPAAKTCEDLNEHCAPFAGYAGTPSCQGWAATNCPKTCKLC